MRFESVYLIRRALLQQAFIGTTFNNPGGAAKGVVQLWNPNGSGVTLWLYKINMSSPSAQSIQILHSVAALNNPINGVNKYLGAAASVGELRDIAVAAPVGTQMNTFDEPANGRDLLIFTPPVVIPENHGVSIAGATVDLTVRGNFEWVEIP